MSYGRHVNLKPRLLVCASPTSGHTGPVIRIVSELATRGYQITFLAGEQFHDAIRKFGGTPVLLPPEPETWISRMELPPGEPRFIYDMEHFFILPTARRQQHLYQTLEMMQMKDSRTPIVIITETFFLGSNPMCLGAPMPRGFTVRPKVINIHSLPYVAYSRDAAPFGRAMLPDTTTEAGRSKIQVEWDKITRLDSPWVPLMDIEEDMYAKLGATEYKRPLASFDTWMLSSDITLQMCVPSLEFPRSDMPSKVRFAGTVPPRAKNYEYPDFWLDVVRGDKKVVVVTQGTVATDLSHLLMPTIRALAGLNDVLTVAILGTRGASLPDDFIVPANARIVDYLPYDAILPHAHAFVSNAGYGGFMHGIINGVPMVLGGHNEDKPEVAMRAAWAGVGINLETDQPQDDQLTIAVRTILDDPRYLERVSQIKQENEKIETIKVVEDAIVEVLAIDEWPTRRAQSPFATGQRLAGSRNSSRVRHPSMMQTTRAVSIH